jgi:hypothetical protein
MNVAAATQVGWYVGVPISTTPIMPAGKTVQGKVEGREKMQ